MPCALQLQKSLTNSENERRVVAERLEVTQQQLAELRRTNQQLSDQAGRLHSELANSEVQRSALESQLRLASSWPTDHAASAASAPDNMREDELNRQLTTAHRERSELRTKVDSLVEKVSWPYRGAQPHVSLVHEAVPRSKKTLFESKGRFHVFDRKRWLGSCGVRVIRRQPPPHTTALVI